MITFLFLKIFHQHCHINQIIQKLIEAVKEPSFSLFKFDLFNFLVSLSCKGMFMNFENSCLSLLKVS